MSVPDEHDPLCLQNDAWLPAFRDSPCECLWIRVGRSDELAKLTELKMRILSDEAIEAFGAAWQATPPGEPGARRRAGLMAILALLDPNNEGEPPQ